ncbi:MAG: phage terminase large subunit, partial [Candidatus Ventricola sp.]
IWALEGEYFSFLATSFGGTMTGIGFNVGIIDDPIKLPEEAHNDAFLDNQFAWYTDAFLSRLEEDAMVVIVMTRWATRDLAGRVMDEEPGEWLYIRMQTPMENGEMLCPELLSRKTYDARARLTSAEILAANYQQEPVDLKGALYQSFATYAAIPRETASGAPVIPQRVCYVDTADTGADYLCAVAADVVEGEAYVLDVIYTDAPMEKTELDVAKMLYDLRVQECIIESNNGGRGFGRNVERILWERFHWRGCRITPRNQRDNKQARMLTHSGFIEHHVKYPEDWRKRWREYAQAMIRFQRKGKNAHDDAPDATTGLAEYVQGGLRRRRKFYSGRGAR